MKHKILCQSIPTSKLKTHQQGYSLIEIAVALMLVIIIVYISSSLYAQILTLHRRQQRVMQVQRALVDTHLSLEQSLISLSGRNIGIFSGEHFSIPLLPGAGSSINQITGKNELIRLGIVTPYIVNDKPAFTVVYSDATTPRLELSDITISGDTATAKVFLPPISTSFIPPPKGGQNEKSITGGVKGVPSPSPSPSPSSSPTPSPEPTKIPDPSSIDSSIPPQIPPDKTLTGLAFIPTPEMFQRDQVMLIAGSPPTKKAANSILSKARVVKLTNVVRIDGNATGLNPSYLQFSFDLCVNDCNGQINGLVNFTDAPNSFAAGSLLIPIKVASFYLKKDSMGSRLIRNDNALILPAGDGRFQVSGGQEVVLGEADNLIINYQLADGSIKPSPSSPLVPWINNITSVDIKLFREMPGLKSENLTHSIDVSFPILIRNID